MPKSILVVDDSALVRRQLSEIIRKHFDFDIDYAKNGEEAVDKAVQKQYDMITMDINMPKLDGIGALKAIMQRQPTPVLMVSSLTSQSAGLTIEALESGAVDYVTKPGTMKLDRSGNSEELVIKLRSLSRIPKRRYAKLASVPPRYPDRKEEKTKAAQEVSSDITKVVLIGASTGGPGLIEQLCASFPESYPYPVCIVQHMPEKFTEAFANRLNRVSLLEVHHTSNGQSIVPGNIYLARGGAHLHFARKSSGTYCIREEKKSKGLFFQPSVNEMFNSAVDVFGGQNIIAVLLSGIGDDGADGMVAVKEAGGMTYGENEESCIVYGMPKEALLRGGVCEELPFPEILHKLTNSTFAPKSTQNLLGFRCES